MLKAAIIGCGNIAGFLDSPDQTPILTHAHAYQEHPDTKLIAVCDPSLSQREKFVALWDKTISHYSCLSEMLTQHDIDVISICSPTPFHFEAMQSILNEQSIKHIICEKPFIQTQNELETLLPILHTSDKNIIINFMRRYDPGIQEVKKIIDSETLGSIEHFNASFTKGLYHNGSHMLELIEYLCGSIKRISANNIQAKDDDLYGSFYLETSSTHGSIHNESGTNYALFELEIVLSYGRIKILESAHKIEIEHVQASKRYPGYYSLEYKESLPESLHKSLWHTLMSLLNKTDTLALNEHLSLSQKLLRIKQDLYTQQTLEFI